MDKIISLILFLYISLFTHIAHASKYILLPDSKHDAYTTKAIFSDDLAAIYKLTKRSTWLAIGGAFALLENEEMKYKPQLIVIGSAKAWMEVDQNKSLLLPQTIDAQAGVQFDITISEIHLATLGWYHVSGHAADEIFDKSLLVGNVGSEILFIRSIHYILDENKLPKIKFGATFKPIVASDPRVNIFAADQFIEYYPFGYINDLRHGNFYTAFGIEEMGVESIRPTYHFQTGFSFLNDFNSSHHSGFRIVAGYYHGWDPRYKYYELRQSRLEFIYAGIALHI